MIEDTTTYANVTMSNKTLFHIWEYQQKLSAKLATTRTDKTKTTLSMREKYNKLAQIGRRLRYRDITFTYEDGFGVLCKANGEGIINATIGDFVKEVEKEYGYRMKWYYEGE